VAPDGSVYVLDSGNDRIQKFTAGGQFAAKWGSYGSDDGQFAYPAGIAVAPDGSVYVVDWGNDRIQRFTADGQFVNKWGSYGSDSGQFAYPADVAVAPDGSVYVLDSDNNRIQKFTADGRFLKQWESWIDGFISVDRNGSVYVGGSDYVQKLTGDGQFLSMWGGDGTDPGCLNFVSGLAIDSTGRVYVCDSGNDRIQVFFPAATIAFNISDLTTDLAEPPLVNNPVTITLNTQGDAEPLYYRYYQKHLNQSRASQGWQLVRDWSTDNTIAWTPEYDSYSLITAHVTSEPLRDCYAQATVSVETSGNSSSPVVIADFTTNITYPHSSTTPIIMNTTASGGRTGFLYYRYLCRKGLSGGLTEIRGHDTDNGCTWTPPDPGLYTLVVEVSDNASENTCATAGMTCTIGE
jgi:hypothetical protein